MGDRKLGGARPQDSREWDAQCGRCGSTLTFEDCGACGGDGYVDHDCGEDSCPCADPEINVPCGVCDGEGGFPFCISSEEWCNANPRVGRENVERSTVEWFCLDAATEVARG